ncbi:uncharacterized protein Z519_02008 [Cladophialophora bantiana CBS 173.52]|uniref:Uncharacterized protein n=1 Tax=Cladophialophora bantiana (strain ATCC 10958 / CBS 173.52 / CDC B-1940 / NIH 8579) TaxID=1442370 RepID=A0A0D2GE22_CLAB1|nr:uncharacterized protein Z519_02008 [Cladophialophora bantiana CBS 173.52]KIW96617.1 hypothetical protein Z519_02008 [Cladophialophora bantiana CBS 173.52]
MKHLGHSITTEMKFFSETISAQIKVLNTSMESRMDKFENRFLFRMLFAAFGVVIIGVGGTVTAAILRYQTPTAQTPTVQTPAVQTAQAPTVK